MLAEIGHAVIMRGAFSCVGGAVSSIYFITGRKLAAPQNERQELFRTTSPPFCYHYCIRRGLGLGPSSLSASPLSSHSSGIVQGVNLHAEVYLSDAKLRQMTGGILQLQVE